MARAALWSVNVVMASEVWLGTESHYLTGDTQEVFKLGSFGLTITPGSTV